MVETRHERTDGNGPLRHRDNGESLLAPAEPHRYKGPDMQGDREAPYRQDEWPERMRRQRGWYRGKQHTLRFRPLFALCIRAYEHHDLPRRSRQN